MDRDPIRPGIRKVSDITLWLDDHQMNIQRKARTTPRRFDHQRPHRDIGDKAPVHHINMNQIAAARLSLSDLLAQPGKIRSQDRRGNANSKFIFLTGTIKTGCYLTNLHAK